MSDRVKKVLLGLSVILIVLLVAIIAYLARQNRELKGSIESEATITTIEQSVVSTSTITPKLSQTSMVSPEASSSPQSDEELIKAAYAKKISLPESDISINISNSSSNAAYGTVSVSGGGGWFVAVRENGAWSILAAGNGTIECSVLEGRDVPASVVGECYDSSADQLITR